jgi:hypothetical protein
MRVRRVRVRLGRPELASGPTFSFLCFRQPTGMGSRGPGEDTREVLRRFLAGRTIANRPEMFDSRIPPHRRDSVPRCRASGGFRGGRRIGPCRWVPESSKFSVDPRGRGGDSGLSGGTTNLVPGPERPGDEGREP